MLEHLVTKFCEKLDIELRLDKDKEDFFTLVLNSETIFKLKDQNPGFYARALVGTVPEGSHEDLYIHYMKANYLGQGTGGCALALTRDTKTLMLVLSVGQDVNDSEFSDYLETYANYLDYWKNHLENYKQTKGC